MTTSCHKRRILRPVLAAALVAAVLAGHVGPAGAAGAATKPAAPAKRVPIRKKLARKIERLSFADIGLKDVFQFLREYSGANLHVCWRVLGAAGIERDTKISLDVRRISVLRALELVARDVSGASPKSDVTFVIEPNLVIVSTKVDLAPDGAAIGRQLLPWTCGQDELDAGIRKQLTKRIERLSFANIDLKDVLQFLREYGSLNFHVNWRALGARAGVKPDTKVGTDVRDVTVREALELILRDVAGTAAVSDAPAYAIERGVIEISTVGELFRVSGAAGGQQLRAVTALPPAHDLRLGFLRPGRVAKVAVKDGDPVKAGQELARLDDAAERARLEQLKGEAGEVRVRAVQTELALKESMCRRVEAAVKKGEAEAVELEHAKLEVKLGRLMVELVKLERRAAGHRVREAEIELKRTRLTSPVDGRVQRVRVGAGEAVDALAHVVHVVRTDLLAVDVPVPLKQARRLKRGQTAIVHFGDARRSRGRGKVVWVSRVADAGSQTLTVRVELPNPTARPAGERVSVTFPPGG